VKKNLALYPDTEAERRDRTSRSADRHLILKALREHTDSPPSLGVHDAREFNFEILLATHRHLARTPSALVAVSLDDVLGVLNQQNMPGTIDTHPNWRQKVPVELGDLLGMPEAHALARMFMREHRGAASSGWTGNRGG
jgi:4-alpha-glucanotransferase